MGKPKAIVMRAAGTNCDAETAFALETAGAIAERVHVNRLTENPELLQEYSIAVIPGGFSYGDDVSAGAVFANELIKRLGEQLYRFSDDGKPILGICNGFQVLVKTGLLPGIVRGKRQVNLEANDSGKFEDRWTYLSTDGSKCIFTKGITGVVYAPVAHGEGKVVALGGIIDKLVENGQVVFRYAYENGEPAGGNYPENPNGSEDDIAGICDPSGTRLGLMPHPERHIKGHQHPRWYREGAKAEGDGVAIFRNAVRYARQL